MQTLTFENDLYEDYAEAVWSQTGVEPSDDFRRGFLAGVEAAADI